MVLLVPAAYYWEISLAQEGNKINQMVKNRCTASERNEGELNRVEWMTGVEQTSWISIDGLETGNGLVLDA